MTASLADRLQTQGEEGGLAPPPGTAAGPRSAAVPFGRWLVAGFIVVGLAFAAQAVASEPRGATLSLSLTLGALFGFVLQRSRFCFYCHWRELIDERDPRGVLAILAALALGILGYALIVGAWMPDPSAGRLPPTAHVGPVGPVLVLAGLAFGAGMAISGSCISAHLYRLGEGSPTAPFALVGAAFGFVLGFSSWNPLYLASVSEAPIPWLPRWLGHDGAVLVPLAALGALALWLLTRLPPPREARRAAPQAHAAHPAAGPLSAIFVRRWPAWLGGLAVGLIGTASYFRIGPLGVTSEIGARSREAANALGLLPERLEGLDAFRGCATAIRESLLTPNGLFVAGLVLASFAAALVAGQFRPARPSRAQALRGLSGGVLLGWGAMTGLGCSVGTFLSGASAGAVSGWVFGAAMFAAATVTLLAGRRFGLLDAAARPAG